MMSVSPQVILFVLFMLAVFGATRIDEVRQQHRKARDGRRHH